VIKSDPPVKMRIALAADLGIQRSRKLVGKRMPVLAIVLFLAVTAPFGGMVFGNVDKEPATKQVQYQPQNIDIVIDTTEEQATKEVTEQ